MYGFSYMVRFQASFRFSTSSLFFWNVLKEAKIKAISITEKNNKLAVIHSNLITSKNKQNKQDDCK